MNRGPQGNELIQRVPGEPYRTFVPFDLPPNPPLALDVHLSDALERANRALGRLDGLGLLIPNLSLFLYYYVRKEAVLSSQIEGTQSSLSDLLLYESDAAPGVRLHDVNKVSNYVAALNYGMERLQADQPLTLRLLRAALDLNHQAIMKSIRHLQDLMVLTEISGRQRKQVFAYRPLLDILSEGTELGRG